MPVNFRKSGCLCLDPGLSMAWGVSLWLVVGNRGFWKLGVNNDGMCFQYSVDRKEIRIK
jgi:hypothetical protein